MSAEHHALRPLENYVLVCEGESDAEFLNGVLGQYAPEIYVIEAKGEGNVNTLAHICSPSVYIKDRDFNISHEDARALLTATNYKSFWPCFDIEGYLLQVDWLLEALRTISESQNGVVSNMPESELQILETIKEIAAYFAADHAGRETLHYLTTLANPRRFNAVSDSHYGVLQNAQASDQDTWLNVVLSESARLRMAGGEVTNLPQMDIAEVTALFDIYYRQYLSWADTLDTIRIHFSGKRILQALTLTWRIRRQLRDENAEPKPWQTLQKVLIEKAVIYTQRSITGLLQSDSRLGDFGLLASKILQKNI